MTLVKPARRYGTIWQLRMVLAFTAALCALLVTVYLGFPNTSGRFARRAASWPDLSELGEPLVIAHRGASRLRPENTLVAFAHAVQLGVGMLEMDVRLSLEGIPVVMHDATVDRTTNASGPVAGYRLAELKKLDAAYHWSGPGSAERFSFRGQGIAVPTLEEVFRAFPQIPMTLDIKPDSQMAVIAVGRLIARHHRWNRTLVASFNDRILCDFREAFPEAITSAGPSEVRKFWLLSRSGLWRWFGVQAAAFQVPETAGNLRVVSPSFVAAAHRQKIDVHVWTVNDPGDMERLIGMGVDGIVTDRPDLLLKLLGKKRGAARPALIDPK